MITLLDRVTATIVFELGKVGLFHYNKLTFLFEYFFIKNFGERYTKEFFVKLPHGPVIPNYKKQISHLAGEGIYFADLSLIKSSRKLYVDDFHFRKIEIAKTEITGDFIIQERIVHELLLKVLDKFAGLSVANLERLVYKTQPMIRFAEISRFKKGKAPYILNDCIKMVDFKDKRAVRGRKLYLEHIRKYPTVNKKQLEENMEFFREWKKLAAWPKEDENGNYVGVFTPGISA